MNYAHACVHWISEDDAIAAPTEVRAESSDDGQKVQVDSE